MSNTLAATAAGIATSTSMAAPMPTARPKLQPGQFPPGYIPNYALLAGWDSEGLAYGVMGVVAAMTLCMAWNVYRSRSLHTRIVYAYLIFWGILRLIAFAMRGHVLTGTNGRDLATYKWAQIIVSVGFMPLAEVCAANVLAGTTLVFKLTPLSRRRLNIFLKVLFLGFVLSILWYVYDFTINKPFGSKPLDYTSDVVFREIGFNGLLAIVVYTFFAAIRNLVYAQRKTHIAAEFVRPVTVAMAVVLFQSSLMLLKLIYITYRNWNPDELKEEKYWYSLSILPELVFVLPFCSTYFLRVFDDIAGHPTGGVIPDLKVTAVHVSEDVVVEMTEQPWLYVNNTEDSRVDVIEVVGSNVHVAETKVDIQSKGEASTA
ncbi:hypothetical protein HDU81_006220 [Chytriomyces hyalinus]|nr:hypothetical protein HDU81_006220 [Chytriomyces hyalinus]